MNTLKNYVPNQEVLKTIVAFHIGRGGKFYNQGHKTFIDQDVSITKYTNELFLNYANQNDFKKRYGFDSADDGQCILDLMSDRNLDELEEKFGITEDMLGDYIYTDGSGNPVGLTFDESETGIGMIDIDGDYDTTYTCYLEECSDEELNIILNSNSWKSNDVVLYCKWRLDIED